ncbi:MAG: GTPase Era [Candidatus Omnitrophota bacterium]
MANKISDVFKSGFTAIIGKPNVGKSTIMNLLLGEKLAIVSPKPETTRDKIIGISTHADSQEIYIDTPGIHRPKNLLAKEMVRRAGNSIGEADLVLCVVVAHTGLDRDDRRMLSLADNSGKPAILVLNKTDLVKDKKLILPMMDELSKNYNFKQIIPVSAKKGDNIEVLKKKITEYLPKGPKYFEDGQITDRDECFIAKELIREKVLELTREEVPHSVAVLIEEWTEKPKKTLTYIRALVVMERTSQRKIIIGHRGSMIKQIGENARQDIEKMLGRKVYLELWAKVMENWRKDSRALKLLGYL